MIVNYTYVCEVKPFLNKRLELKLIVLLFIEYNVIRVMNWLSNIDTHIDYYKKRVTLHMGDIDIYFLRY